MARPYYRSYPEIKELSRKLRRNQTQSEKSVWDILRKRKICGCRFLRQHPVFYREQDHKTTFFIADFYCRELNLIIEVDGGIHLNQKEYDKERDELLHNKGLKVIRIENEITFEKESLSLYLEKIIAERFLYITDI